IHRKNEVIFRGSPSGSHFFPFSIFQSILCYPISGLAGPAAHGRSFSGDLARNAWFCSRHGHNPLLSRSIPELPPPSASSLFAALIPWTYFSSSLTCTTNVVVESQHLITKVYFPRLILPISSVLSGLVDFAIGFVVLSIFCFAYGILPTLTALWLPVLLLLAL